MNFPLFEPVFPVPVIIGITSASALLAIGRAIFGKPLKPAWMHAPVMVLRLAAIALVTLFLMNPSDSIAVKAPQSRALVLLDASASMSLGAPSRWEEACKWVHEFRASMTSAGQEPPALALFASDVEPVRDPVERKPDGVETKLSSAIERVLLAAGATPPDHIVVVSDGRAQDRQSLPGALALAHARHTGVSTLAFGSDTPQRNAGIAAVSAPRVVRANSRVTIQVELAASGYAPGEPLSLSLRDEEGKRLGGAELRAPASGGTSAECVLSFESGVRSAKYFLELASAAGDLVSEDNHFEFSIEVATSKLRVLFVEGTHVKRSVGTSGYWWNDMELMTRAWDATGEIEYECLTPVSEYQNSPNLIGVTFSNGEMIPDKSRNFPKTREELYRFDVMMISDVPVGNFSTEQMEWVVDWVVERGGGFLMGGGYTSFDVGRYDQTPWERITPVDMLAFGDGFNEQRFKVEIPKSVRKHPTWRIVPDPGQNDEILNLHPDFTGMNRVRRAKPGALVLMTRPGMNGEPVIAAQQYGRGRSIAYLGDPNGGWAKFLVGWGPPGGPVQGPHTEIGHGDRFRVNLAATKAASGPPPPHPSPYYAQYWVNVAKWLGENSVRWRRDKLAGRVTTAQAQPGHDLPVAAEVLAVTNRDALLALNVGARLDRPGSPRLRMEYDRDRREFTGSIPIPRDFPARELTVLFDTVAEGGSLTDAVNVGVRHENPEFAETAPDRAFLAELAKVGGGRVIESTADAVEVCRQAAMIRTRETQRSWSQPAWTRWPWWAALTALLCTEWAFRRRAATNAAMVAGLLLFFATPAWAEEGSISTADIAALIEKLGAPRVRERDEAEEKLKETQEALAAVKTAAKNAANPEIRLRARNVAQVLRQDVWQQELVGEGHRMVPVSYARTVVASPDGKRFYTRGEDHVRVWESESCKPGIAFGAATGMWHDWQRGGPLSTLAVSPDGKRVVCTDDIGSVLIHNSEDGAELIRFTNQEASGESIGVNQLTVWGASFFPDGRQLATCDRGGWLRIWNSESGEIVKSIPVMPGVVNRCVAVSPNGELIGVSIDFGGEPDHLWVWNVARSAWVHKQETTNRLNTLSFSRDGRRLLGAHHGGIVNIWEVAPDGALSGERRIGPIGNHAMGAAFSSDEKTVFAVTDIGDGQLSQWDVETGEELWRSPHLERGLEGVAVLGLDRVVTIGIDERVRIWQRHTSARK
ncbi:MAG: hypothetical protein JWL59_5072 [Chthoniobacteraceae bacterium]|nr:hypothetical protein [Chthoniobacteraceae bacterium]